MEQLKSEMDALSEAILDFKQVANPEVVDAADEMIKSVRTEHTRFTIDKSYERFLVKHIKAEKQAFQDGDRTEPLCSCSNPYCNLKQGKLPPAVALGETTDDGLQAFLMEHDGGEIVDEARDQWVEDAGVVIQTLTEALSLLKSNELPEDRVDEDAEESKDETDAESDTDTDTPEATA